MPDAGSPRNQSDRGHVLEDLIAQYKSLFWIHFICYLLPQDRIRLPKRRWFGGGSFSFFLFHLAWMIETSLTGSKNLGCKNLGRILYSRYKCYQKSSEIRITVSASATFCSEGCQVWPWCCHGDRDFEGLAISKSVWNGDPLNHWKVALE